MPIHQSPRQQAPKDGKKRTLARGSHTGGKASNSCYLASTSFTLAQQPAADVPSSLEEEDCSGPEVASGGGSGTQLVAPGVEPLERRCNLLV